MYANDRSFAQGFSEPFLPFSEGKALETSLVNEAKIRL